MISRRRARYGYKPFLTSTFAFIYQFMIQKAFKFIVKDIFGRNSSPKVFLDGQRCHKFFTTSPSIFVSFQNIVAWSISTVGNWNEPCNWFMLSTSCWPNLVVIESNAIFFKNFSIIGPNGPIFTLKSGIRKRQRNRGITETETESVKEGSKRSIWKNIY